MACLIASDATKERLVDLKTQYLGLTLKHPFMLGASPITHDIDRLKQMVDAGASAVVMHSLFEEQLGRMNAAAANKAAPPLEDDSEIPESMRPSQSNAFPAPEDYLAQLATVKRSVNVPVIASLNGATDEGWLYYAKHLEDAGADALELNVYHLALDPEETGEMIEKQLVEMVQQVAQALSIPVAVKLSPCYSGLPNLARRLTHAGARGLVLFNRYYEPDINVDSGTLEPKLELSNSSELTMRLRWLAALSPKVSASLAVTGGVHTGLDAIKGILAGASAIQVVSAPLQRGPAVFGELQRELKDWLVKLAYDGLGRAIGAMDLARCPDPSFYHRGNYLKALQSFRR